MIARAIVWLRFLVVPAWVVGAALLTAHLPSGLGSEAAELGSLLPRSSKAVEVEKKSIGTYGFPLISRSMVVAHKEGGFGAGDTAAALRFVAETDRGKSGLKAVPFATEGKPLEGGRVGDTLLIYLYDAEVGETVPASEAFASGLRQVTGADTAHLTGALPAAAAESSLVEEQLLWVEIATVIVVVGILAIYFRSLAIPLLCLAGVGLSYLVTDRLLGLVAENSAWRSPKRCSR